MLQKLLAEISFYKRLLAHDRTPRLAKALVYGGLAYLASPIDLIPDFVPILGQLDDVLIVGGLLYLARLITPGDVISQCKAAAELERAQKLEKNG
ncbi:MAG: YkvA family protein [Pseudomonadota bacterium]